MLEPIPGREKILIKDAFIERYKKLLGKDYDKFMDYSLAYIKKSIRINTLKAKISDVKKKLSVNWNLKQVPWCKEGFWVEYKNEKRFDIGNIPEHQLGQIYVQDAASMIPAIVLNPKPGDVVLDMCAAPGSKTTQIAQYMKNEGLLVSNDNQGKRLKALGLNTQRCGVSNCIVTHQQGHWFKKMAFDKILVDAPCSGTGTIRRSLKTLQMWSPHLVRKMAGIQKGLVEAAFMALKPGGVMVYSTCTQEPEENEALVSWLLNRYPDASLEDIKLNINRSKAITSFDDLKIRPEAEKCLRIYPFDNDTEGFFIAKIKKPQKK
ncbi:MAG: RsmB/NOP family class I SAM-dependent RNA methyltransferase [Nanoarchaeota archaeon]|nr:RsmB/NOP family class I SAM-dependent RNA methyltransferase [Nanoarchaeota archaeon]